MPGLSDAVRVYRYKLMSDFMREQGLDALAFSSADWFEWASNNEVHDHSWERPFVLVVTASGRSFAVISELSRHHLGAGAERGSLWIDSVHCYSESPHREGQDRTLQQWAEIAADALTDAGLARGRIGVDSANNPLSRAASRLPNLQLTPAGPALRRLRWIKHPDEIETMRRAAALCDWAMTQYREELSPGRLLAEVDYRVAAKLVAEASRRVPGENFVITGLLTLSGSTSAGPKGDGAPTGKTVENNAVAITALGARLNGMAMELARSWLVGSPPQNVVTLFDCALTGQQASIEAAVAGNPVSGIQAAALDVFKRAGVAAYFGLRAGHGIGVVMHDFPEDLPFNDRPLLAGETYAIEPSLCVPRVGGFRFSDTLLIGTGKAQRLTQPSTRAQQILS